jgi:hypothetical protein
VGQLVALGALQQQPGQEGEALTPLGSHLCAMPMDAALGKALLYGCMLRWEGGVGQAAPGRPGTLLVALGWLQLDADQRESRIFFKPTAANYQRWPCCHIGQ